MNAKRAVRLVFAAIAAALAACAPSGAPRGPAIFSGTITYRERLALPDAARVEIQILDVTDPDAEKPPLVAEKLIPAPGQVPIAFALDYDPQTIDPNHVYALRVRIRVGEDLWFASPFDLKILTAGNPNRVEVMLDRVSAGAPTRTNVFRVDDPDPPNLDARLRPVRDEARAIDARLDRFDMREIPDGETVLRLWMLEDQPMKLEVSEGALTRPSSYYFRDGRLFWLRTPTGGFVFEGDQLVLRTDARLVPVAEAGSGAGVQRDLVARLALFGL